MKQDPKSSWVLDGPLGEGQHNVSALCGGMGDKSIIGSTMLHSWESLRNVLAISKNTSISHMRLWHDDLLADQRGAGGQRVVSYALFLQDLASNI